MRGPGRTPPTRAKVRSMSRTLEYLPVDRLVPADRNPKRHDQATLGASISRFGYIEPIVLDERTGKLVAGHGRLEQLRSRASAGEEPPEGVTVDADGNWLVPVVRGWASADDAEAEAYLLAANRTTELGGWDPNLLADALEASPNLDGIGFSDDDLRQLLAETGRLARDTSSFLDGIDDVDEGRGRDRQDGPAEWATLAVTLPRDVRQEVVRLLRAAKDALGAETLADTLVEIIRRFRVDDAPQ